MKMVPVVNMELAIEPNRHLLTKIRDKLADLIGKSVIISYVVNPKLMAGARVMFAGKYLDQSLDAKWGDMWKEINNQLFLPQNDS